MSSLFQGKKNKFLFFIISLLLIASAAYGIGRLYFKVTGGFQIKHITSDLAYDPRWVTRSITPEETETIHRILSQNFHYLGKGCQSYVFQSHDGQYVIKFFKYQRFRPQFYLYWFSFIPQVNDLLQEKLEKKLKKRESLFGSWKIAFDNLKEESGLVYVHLNKSSDLKQTVTLYDKIGRKHELDIDTMEFMLQKRADMLCDRLDFLMQAKNLEEAKALLTRLVDMVVWEYRQGVADNDHALMQNTGVIGEKPVHIDIGQFEINRVMQDPALYHQELFNKMWKFRIWLQENHPELVLHLDRELQAEMGERFFELKFIPKVR